MQPLGGGRHSIIRRSLAVVVIVLLGHCFNYLFVLLANRSIDAATFGRFYTAWATINVLGTPGAVFALLLTRYYAEAFHANGEGAVWQSLKRAARVLAPWVVGAAVVLEIGLNLTGTAVADSTILIGLLPLVAATGFGVELVRAAYPAAHRSFLFAGVFLARCVLECGLGLAGLMLLRTVCGAYAGVLAAGIVILAVEIWLAAWLFGRTRSQEKVIFEPARLQLRDALPFCSAYVGFVLLNNADILVAYFVLNASQLGVYSAAAVLPKAIVTATQPVAQIILPILIAVKGQVALTRNAVYKALGVTLAMGIAGLLALWVGSGLVCGSRVGIQYCNVHFMLVLAVAAVMLAVVRIAVTVDLGQRLYWLAHVPLLGCLAFVLVELSNRPSTAALATSYTLASFGVLAIFGILSIARAHFRNGLLAWHT